MKKRINANLLLVNCLELLLIVDPDCKVTKADEPFLQRYPQEAIVVQEFPSLQESFRMTNTSSN